LLRLALLLRLGEGFGEAEGELEPGRPELSYAESYLVREDYIRPSTSYQEDNSYTITETSWEDFGYQATAEGWKRKAWWRRMLGG
jgi:hypothetical protein